MKRTLKIAIAMLAVVTLAAVLIGGTANVPEFANTTTSRFSITDIFVAPDAEVSMINEEGDLIIHISEDTPVYFEDYVPLSDEEGAGLTRDAREVLFGRTLAEVLDGRNLRVTYGFVLWSFPGQTTPLSVEILFETAVPLPIDINGNDGGYIGIVPPIGEIDEDWYSGYNDDYGYYDVDLMTLVGALNGEIAVNNSIIDAPAPFIWRGSEPDGDVHVTTAVATMVPLRAVIAELGHDVVWDEYAQSIRLGVGTHIFIGRAEAHIGRAMPRELSTAPVIVDNIAFVPLDFFRNVLSLTAYVFEGQVVIETRYVLE